PTGSAFGSVGALFWDRDGNGTIDRHDLWCSGSLIAPDVFLTAAHCVATPLTPPGTQFYVTFAPDLSAPITVISATRVVYDPLFGHDVAKVHDVALVFLTTGSTRRMTPLELPTAGILDALKDNGSLATTLFLNVGYGADATRPGRAEFPLDGVRKSATSEFGGLTQELLKLQRNLMSTDGGGDCFGDSGSPKFILGDPTTAYAVTSMGDPNCRSHSDAYRLDTPEARDWLGQYLPLP
ncbi:MAG TPA: trypsin-like serine protease, partial [Gemmatimonadaceae bacterium]